MGALRITGLFTLAPAGRGFRLARSFATLIPTPAYTHIFLRPETAARFLYRAQKNVPEKNRTKGRSPDCGFSPAHFARRWNCYAIPLSRRSKRRIQPERYMQWGLNWLINIKFTGKILDKNETVPLGADRKSVV
jgi:hypothetical protein